MGYRKQNGEWADTEELIVKASGTIAADVDGDSLELGDRSTLRLLVTATAASGTMDITMQTSPDNSTWRTLGTFTQLTGTGSERKSFPGCDRFVRASYNVSGGGSYTLSIVGEAV